MTRIHKVYRCRVATTLLVSLLAIGLTACGGGEGDEEAPSSDPNYSLKKGARVINADNARLIAQDDASITIDGNAAAGLTAGDVIVSTLGMGALRRVVSVQALATGGWRVATEAASLTEAFERFHLKLSKTLDSTDLGTTFSTGETGLELTWNATPMRQQQSSSAKPQASVDGPTLTLAFKKWEVSASKGFQIDGSASFKLQPDFSVDLVPVVNSSIPALTYRAALSPAYSHQYTVSSLYGGTLAASKEKEIALRPIILASPPVTIVPYVVVSASAGGSAAGNFSITHTASISGSAYVSRAADGTAEAGHSFQPLMQGQFDSAEAALGATITPARISLEFRIYNVGGPQFELSANGKANGTYEHDGVTGAEGIRAQLTGDLTFTAGVGGNIGFLTKLFSDFRGSFTLFSKDFVLKEGLLYDHFFPFTGNASIKVYDNGNAADDIFEVSVDGAVLGRTTKGGSGQFRAGSLRPGNHTLRLLTVEDDSPPGTWAVQLANGVTFADGSTAKAGSLALGSASELQIVVPAGP